MYRAYSHQQIAALIQNAVSGVTGSGNITFGAVTSTGSGTSTVTGSASLSMGGMTTTAAGTPTVTGSANVTFGAVTTSASGTATVTGSASVGIGALTVTASGTSALSGSASITLGAMSTSGNGTVSVQGSASVGFGAMTVAGAGTVAGAIVQVRSKAISREAAIFEVLAESGPSRPPRPVSSALGGDYTVTNSFADSGLSVNLSRRGWWLISTTLRVDHDAASGDLEARLVCGGTNQAGMVMLGALTPMASISGQWLYQNKSGVAAKIQARKTINAGSSLLKAADSSISAIWTGT